MKGTGLIMAGGILNGLLTVFHMLFWRFLDWPLSLASLSPDNRAVMQVLNLQLVLVFLLFTYASLFKGRELLLTSLGRVLAAAIGLFYLLRAANEFVFWNVAEITSQLLVVLCLVLAGLYLAPLYQNRRSPAALAGNRP